MRLNVLYLSFVNNNANNYYNSKKRGMKIMCLAHKQPSNT